MAPSGARTTRIFVARIPQSVTDTQFRAYFEKYGRLQVRNAPPLRGLCCGARCG